MAGRPEPWAPVVSTMVPVAAELTSLWGLVTSSSTKSQAKRTAVMTKVMSSTSPMSRSVGKRTSSQVGETPSGSCMPSMTKSTPVMMKMMTSHTLAETMLARAVAAVVLLGPVLSSSPPATTARMPLTWSASAAMKRMKGASTSITTVTVVFARPVTRSRARSWRSAAPITRPMPMPPKKSTRKVMPASAAEKVPVTAAAMANWKQTTPEASLMRASPESRAFCRGESLMSLPSATTAAASVGPSAAPRAKAAASVMLGCTRLRAKPAASVATSTRPTASETIGALLRHSASLSTCWVSL